MGFFLPSLKFEDVLRESQALIAAGKLPEALKMLQKAEKRNLFHAELFLTKAKVYKLLGNPQAYQEALDSFIKENERDVQHHLKIVEEEIAQKDFAFAQQYLDRAKQRFPLSGYTHAVQASLHCAQADFESAAKALLQKQTYGKLDDRDIDLVHQIRKAPHDAHDPHCKNITALLATEQVDTILRRSVYEHFESLGSDCEFGFLQRTNGREPLSLFRWGTMPLGAMIELFRHRFKDFATKETASLKLVLNPEDGKAEYRFIDKLYQFDAHTFFTKKNMDISESAETLLPKVLSHFSLLARKLLEDLEDGEKIFLYKSDKIIDTQQCIELHEAINTIGNNRLLIVMRQEKDRPAFEVINPRLVIGRVDYLWTDVDNPHKPFSSIKCWDALIQKAHQFFSAEQAG